MRTKAQDVLVVFIIDSLNSLIVKDFTQKIILEKILIKVSNSLLNFIDRPISIPRVLYSYGGSSSMVEYRPVAPGEWVRFPPAALFFQVRSKFPIIFNLKTTKYINKKQTR